MKPEVVPSHWQKLTLTNLTFREWLAWGWTKEFIFGAELDFLTWESIKFPPCIPILNTNQKVLLKESTRGRLQRGAIFQ